MDRCCKIKYLAGLVRSNENARRIKNRPRPAGFSNGNFYHPFFLTSSLAYFSGFGLIESSSFLMTAMIPSRASSSSPKAEFSVTKQQKVERKVFKVIKRNRHQVYIGMDAITMDILFR